MQITGSLNDEYLIMSMISRHGYSFSFWRIDDLGSVVRKVNSAIHRIRSKHVQKWAKPALIFYVNFKDSIE